MNCGKWIGASDVVCARCGAWQPSGEVVPWLVIAGGMVLLAVILSTLITLSL